MKKYLAFSFLGIIAFALSWTVESTVQHTEEAFVGLNVNNVESLANCENPNGEDCDGHCVEDNMNMKFCAKPGWRSKNCKMGYY